MNGVWWWDYCSSRKSQKCCLAKTCLNKNWVSPFPKLGIHRYPGCPISLAIHRKSRWQEELVSRFVGEEWMRAMCMYIILYNHPEVQEYGIIWNFTHRLPSNYIHCPKMTQPKKEHVDHFGQRWLFGWVTGGGRWCTVAAGGVGAPWLFLGWGSRSARNGWEIPA